MRQIWLLLALCLGVAGATLNAATPTSFSTSVFVPSDGMPGDVVSVDLNTRLPQGSGLEGTLTWTLVPGA